MVRPIKIIDVLKSGSKPSGFEIVEKYETVDALWGLDYIRITDEDIKALKEGKCLYSDNGEYSQIISYGCTESEEK